MTYSRQARSFLVLFTLLIICSKSYAQDKLSLSIGFQYSKDIGDLDGILPNGFINYSPLPRIWYTLGLTFYNDKIFEQERTNLNFVTEYIMGVNIIHNRFQYDISLSDRFNLFPYIGLDLLFITNNSEKLHNDLMLSPGILIDYSISRNFKIFSGIEYFNVAGFSESEQQKLYEEKILPKITVPSPLYVDQHVLNGQLLTDNHKIKIALGLKHTLFRARKL